MGIPLAEYNEMTPRELNLSLEVYELKRNNDDERALFHAYVNAYWHRVEILKSFNEMIGKEEQSKVMTEEQMFKKMMELNSAFGGIVAEPEGKEE